MVSKRRHFGKGWWRRIGGTVILNLTRPPMKDLVLADISRRSRQIGEPYSTDAVRHIFALKHGHDGALLIHLFDQRTGQFNPTVHSSQNAIPIDLNTVPEWLSKHFGMRHQSGYCMSMLTNAIVVVVSEEYGRLCIFHSGDTGPVATTVITTDNFLRGLRASILSAMQKERAEHAALYGSVTLAESYTSMRCMVSACTAERLKDEKMADWFLFYYVECRDQLRISANSFMQKGAFENTDGVSLTVGRRFWRQARSDDRTPVIQWTGKAREGSAELDAHKFRVAGEELLKRLKDDAEPKCYVLQYGAVLCGGFVIRVSNDIVSIESTFVSPALIESRYFHRLLAAFFRHQKLASTSDLEWLSSVPFSVEPIIVDTTVQRFIDVYGHKNW